MEKSVAPWRLLSIKSYALAMLVVCAAYLLFELLCIPRLWLGVDEFWFAHHVYQFTQHLPYRDFAPYKPVLGYYLLSLPLHGWQGVLTPIFYVKDEIAIINTLMLVALAWYSQRRCSQPAIFYTLLLIICNQFFLMFSTELRVDMLGSWFCLLAMLLVVARRPGWAGVVLALAFLTSPKALWYIMATDLALATYWMTAVDTRQTTRELILLNLAMFLVMVVYVLVWAYFSSFYVVLRSVFYEAYKQSKIVFYAPANGDYWQFILQHGPILILLAPLTILGLFTQEVSRQRLLFITYGVFGLFIIGRYQQFFPYNTVFLLPAYYLLYTEFFTWLLSTRREVLVLSQRTLFWFFSLYMIFLISFMLIFALPAIYSLVAIVPLVVWHSLHNQSGLSLAAQGLLFSTLLVTGVYFPLHDFGRNMHVRDATYQQATIRATDKLLLEDNYIAGTYIFYNKDQVTPGFENLIQPAIEYAQTGDSKLMPILLVSLSITPKRAAEMVADLKSAPLKFYVNNVRIASLPIPVRVYLQNEYQHYWGSIYLYAPTVTAASREFILKFSGDYQLESTQPVVLDQQTLAPGARLRLTQGRHVTLAQSNYRLRFVPADGAAGLNPQFQQDCLMCFLKEPLF